MINGGIFCWMKLTPKRGRGMKKSHVLCETNAENMAFGYGGGKSVHPFRLAEPFPVQHSIPLKRSLVPKSCQSDATVIL
jgi:hypothetical protein